MYPIIIIVFARSIPPLFKEMLYSHNIIRDGCIDQRLSTSSMVDTDSRLSGTTAIRQSEMISFC